MDKETNGSQKEKSNELKIDLSLQELDEKIITINKGVKQYKARRLQIILSGIFIAFVVFLSLSAPNIVGHIYGDYPFTITVIFLLLYR